MVSTAYVSMPVYSQVHLVWSDLPKIKLYTPTEIALDKTRIYHGLTESRNRGMLRETSMLRET